MDENAILRGWFSTVELAAIRLAPATFIEKARVLQQRQERASRPRPGGAAMRFQTSTTLPCGTSLTLEKTSSRDGGGIRVVLGRNHATLTGRRLRLLVDRLPETVMAAAAVTHPPLRDVVALGGAMALAGDMLIEDAYEDRGHQVFDLSIERAVIRLADVAAEAEKRT